MKNLKSKYIGYTFLFTAITFSVACNKEYLNPNAATADDVLTSAKGLTGVTVGLQKSYSTTRPSVLYASITLNGLTTNELISINTGNTNEERLVAGGVQVDGSNTILGNVWTGANKIIYDADNVINNAAALPDKNYAAGLIAHASIFKALALGNLSEFWENVPASTGKNVQFVTRIEGYNKAIATIDNAIAVIAANPISTSFSGNIPGGIDIVNTLNALKARYALFAGNYALALTAANAVDLTKKSTFTYDALNLNPLFEIATSTNNVIQPKNLNLGQTGVNVPDAGDLRIPFYTTVNTTVRINGFGVGTFTQIPVYLPGEITLIKAEAYARQATPNLSSSLTELNKIVTKTAATDPFGLGAALPMLTGPYTQQQLLDLIYKHRCIELFMSGLKLDDMRRFNQPLADRKRNFFPYPFQERDNNPNTPANPTF
ncbi:RagB/SusD family nutrient uptake outer membrane protein [Pedobacter frigiditerrae]|uniref:RagB/SusD family nutrient uptake outer membrane protein n=1 Tax=Pedobacter frigiditerrae TaxID=2530452 RepID=A0A4R0N2S7_9SPHI|nr:RagB/SusD family nutrient uptake outer membrane protein [Pedobacter frigiditerrae]TCC94015.1 RagB/SusD family nutrient uptake outer membrane protein [Pedobacter frigiditerrae]